MKRCVVIAGAPIDFPVEDLVREDDFIICADRGWLQAEKHGLVPDMIVGDFDSSPDPSDRYDNVVILPVEKDDTDTHHIARYIAGNSYTDVLMAGVTGGRRIEHTFANISTMLYLAQRGINATAVHSSGYMMVICSGKVRLADRPDSFFSVFPLGDEARGVSIRGGKYVTDRAVLRNDFPIGVSNEFCGNDVEISVEDGSLLIVVSDRDDRI